MQLSIKGKNVELSQTARDYIQRKVEKLARYLPAITEARVEVAESPTHDDQHHIVQITLYERHGAILRGEEHAGDLQEAIDLALGKMHRRIDRYKGKRRTMQRRNGHEESRLMEADLMELEAAEAAEDEDEAQSYGPVVRTKRFAMAPMNAEEAVEQMEMLGHTFFVFYNADSGNVNVVYRRRHGDYGVIVPELA